MDAPLALVAEKPAYRIGKFTLTPRRQLLCGGAPVAIGRKALDLLTVLAQADGALVTKDDLMAAVWPHATVEDNAIQVHVAALRKVLGEDAGLLITVHGLGYRLVAAHGAAVVAAPIAGLEEPAGSPRRHRRLLSAGLAALVVIALVAIGGYLWIGRPGAERPAATPPTIAVLAFAPADGSAEARLFADGLSQSVASSLNRYDVTVIAASSSLRLTPAQKPQARALLGADFVVDGRVSSDHGKLTVSVQISDTRTNTLVYGFDVQGESALSTILADRIATQLALSVDPGKFLNDSTRKFTASDYALIARENGAIESGDLQETIASSRALAERYPDDGDLQASAGIAMLYGIPQMPQSQRAQLVATARADIGRATKLTPHSGLVLFTQAALLNGPESLAPIERLMRLSAQASPTFAPTFNGLGGYALGVGRVDEGVAALRRSTQLDPLSGLVNGAAAGEYVMVGREAEAAQAVARQEAMWPGSVTDLQLRYGMAIYFGSPQDLAAVAKAYPLRLDLLGENQAAADLMLRAVTTHDPALIRQMVANCFATYGQSAGQGWDDICLFRMVQLGDLDDAFRFAARAYPDNRRLYPPDDDRWITNPPLGLDTTRLFTPTMATFRNDPRFWQVALRTGLIDYWQTTQEWPDFCRTQLDVCKRRAAAAAAQTGDALRPR